MKRLLAFAVKVAISVLLLYIAVDFTNLAALRERFDRIEPVWIMAALLALAIQVFLVAARWHLIATGCDVTVSRKRVLVYTLIGLFFNQTLPSTVGGDAARIWLLARGTGEWKSSIYSVLIDRVAGLLWLALVVLVCLPWSLDFIQSPVGRTALVLIGLASIIGVVLLFFLSHIWHDWLNRWRPTRHLVDVATIAWRVLISMRVGGTVAALSILIHLLSVFAAWYIAKSIGSQLDLLSALLLILPVILVAAVPISIAGWGVREGAMVVAFSYAGLPGGDGLMISLLFGAGSFIIGAFGGMMWIVSVERTRIALPTLLHR